MHGSPQQQAALERLQDMFRVTNQHLETLIRGYDQELKAGLAVKEQRETVPRSSDLKMIPSFVAGYPTGFEKGTYLALEISGVDIYVCQVKLKGEGGKLAINQYQYKIPDNLTAGDDIRILIDYVADCIIDFQRRVGIGQQEVYAMAISLGFAIEQTRLDRGVIVALEHGFDFPNAIGCDIVDLFHQRFETKGLAVKIVAIANDAVCTLLAHAYQHPSTRIGIVHSAGTNCAYYERVANMSNFLAHHPDVSPASDMIINTEWCNFGSRYLPMTEFDHRVDNESNNRGIHYFEKISTGMYLGEIVRQVLVSLVDQQVLSFDIDANGDECLLRTPYHFDTSYMYVCEADNDMENLEDTQVVLEEMCKVGETSLADREIVKKVCEMVGHRAAILLGASIASIVKYMVDSGIGFAITGDVYEDYPSFHPRVCETLKALIADDVAAKISVGIVKHSRIVGAAIVAMMAEKMDQPQDVDML
ncbi:uncharacterized protein BYT42DRAFT_502687 [Radiomyces spectabilis]|uniref:uncharacterized protein n=1 Tax=Radiomyces spectabilis TaxID=64574 RepID=UPI00221FC364|nr:uncharacterized protein BYT42DRAFT_502687 [Radiomyces spectabilis]KAI8370717.1 hypothetical protein BYT42DRAFT_502687 [Radiomyces spectabilis]